MEVLINIINVVGQTLATLYRENEDETYRRALKDFSFELCKYLETNGKPLNKTELTEEWLNSDLRKEYKRIGNIK